MKKKRGRHKGGREQVVMEDRNNGGRKMKVREGREEKDRRGERRERDWWRIIIVIIIKNICYMHASYKMFSRAP